MRVAVVIPAYNAGRYLAEAVESVFRQTLSDWELVIVDDGSTDSTADVARKWAEQDARVRVIRQTNCGVAPARNRGFAATSSSGGVLFLDADDVLDDRGLERLADALRADAGAVAAHGLARSIDSYSQACDAGKLEAWGRDRRRVERGRLVRLPPDAPSTLAVLAFRNVIASPGAVLVTRRALEAAGPFDAATAPCEDWDMWLRLSLLGSFAYADRVVLSWRKHGENMSGDGRRMMRGMQEVRRRLLARRDLTPDQRRTARLACRGWAALRCAQDVASARRSLATGDLNRATRHFRRLLARYVRGVLGGAVG